MADLRVTIRVEMDGREVELSVEDTQALAVYDRRDDAAPVVVARAARGVIALLKHDDATVSTDQTHDYRQESDRERRA